MGLPIAGLTGASDEDSATAEKGSWSGFGPAPARRVPSTAAAVEGVLTFVLRSTRKRAQRRVEARIHRVRSRGALYADRTTDEQTAPSVPMQIIGPLG